MIGILNKLDAFIKYEIEFDFLTLKAYVYLKAAKLNWDLLIEISFCRKKNLGTYHLKGTKSFEVL